MPSQFCYQAAAGKAGHAVEQAEERKGHTAGTAKQSGKKQVRAAKRARQSKTQDQRQGRGADNAKEKVLQFVIDNYPNIEIQYTKHGNPKPGTLDMCDSIIIALAGDKLVREEGNT